MYLFVCLCVGRLPGSRIVSSKTSRRGSVTVETRDGEDIEAITQKETEEVKTSRLSFDAMKYATKVEEKLESVSSSYCVLCICNPLSTVLTITVNQF